LKPEPLIALHGVNVALNGATLLRDLNWELRAGEHWIVRGTNGSGKSTFLRLLRAEIWPAPNRGERIYRLDGGSQTTAVEVQRHVALVSPELQERYLQQEWMLRARDVIETGFAQTDFLYVKLTRDQKRRAERIACDFGITALLERDMQTLSTGELRKVLIARAIVGSPKLLLLDEVCDGLDAHFRHELLTIIESIARQGTQIIYTTHRADEALPIFTHEIELRNGRTARQGKIARGESNSGIRSRNRSPAIAKIAGAAAPQQNGSALIHIENADVFLDRRRVLNGIRWRLHRGEHWVVLGGNGAGKTTFLKLIASDLYPVFGARVSRFEFTADNTIWDLRQRIGCVSPLLQAHYREQLSADEVVASGFLSSIGLMEKASRTHLAKARALLDKFGLSHLASRSMLALSFGELRKVLTLRAIVHEPQLLILDEPFDGLDARSRADFAGALQQIANRGTQLIVVTHHLDDLPKCITHGLFLERGRIVASGRWAMMRQHPKLLSLFGG
jgi:molybdate transport system ATP-binding protein